MSNHISNNKIKSRIFEGKIDVIDRVLNECSMTRNDFHIRLNFLWIAESNLSELISNTRDLRSTNRKLVGKIRKAIQSLTDKIDMRAAELYSEHLESYSDKGKIVDFSTLDSSERTKVGLKFDTLYVI